ncbi:hypothetical protein LCM4577_21465 [Mesorhizobium sp. LCM 4577]|uniref:Uncharacterized protein n=1 Tax=Mesorhizobium plurifarium TaxID=69974 RepID=A0A090G0K5_MESPL|nr:hypothetical protein [Mesorhizobium sp. LCM 4577]OHV69645.1 hypothetical protein LCM4577_21465 [Mesorhizobium sp. LCM 4577]CDX49299.1 conserved hypothetical protein [Mesorhizobium plurifarium]
MGAGKRNTPTVSLVAILDWLAFKFSDKRTVGGMLIVYDAKKGGKDADKVSAALQLICDVDPIRHRQVVRDLSSIWITTVVAAAGRFMPLTSICELDERFLMREDISIEEVAGAIVHEATHARLFRRGIGYEEKLRDRVENTCMARELAFAAKLANGAAIRRWVETRQNGSLDYSNAAFDARDVAGMRDALIHLGTPGWIADIVIAIARWRRRRAKELGPGSVSDPKN